MNIVERILQTNAAPSASRRGPCRPFYDRPAGSGFGTRRARAALEDPA